VKWTRETARMMGEEFRASVRREAVRWAGVAGVAAIAGVTTVAVKQPGLVESMLERFDGDSVWVPETVNVGGPAPLDLSANIVPIIARGGRSAAAPGAGSYPNRPAGTWTTLLNIDGTLAATDFVDAFGGAFQCDSTCNANWSTVSDATNPIGTGSVVRIKVPNGETDPGTPLKKYFNATDQTYYCTELYISFHVYLESTWEARGHKWFLAGVDSASRTNIQNANQFFLTHETTRKAELTSQNDVSVDIIRTDDALSLETWHHYELHLIAESAQGNNDGEGAGWLDNVEFAGRPPPTYKSPNDSASWHNVGFNGLNWDLTSSTATTQDNYARFGELLFQGKGCT